MGAGLQRSTLAALCSRGPWAGTHPCDLWTLTGDGVRAMFDAIARGDGPSGGGFSGRAADRALQLLRKSGLIEYAGSPKRWRVVGGGEP